MNLKNCCRLHRPYNENHSCPFRLVQTVLVRAAGETSAEGAEAKWDVRKMIPYLSSRHRMVNKVPFFSAAHSSFALLMQFFLNYLLLLPISQHTILTYWSTLRRSEMLKLYNVEFSSSSSSSSSSSYIGAVTQRGPLPPHSWAFYIPHNDTTQSVGLLRTSDQPVAETSTWQHATLTRERHPRPRRDSNPQSQSASSRRPTS